MKSAVTNASEIFHLSGACCMRAARWCKGECGRARTELAAEENRGRYAVWCPIWEAGDCMASLPVQTRHITLEVDNVSYKEAVQLLQDAGYTMIGGEKQ